MPAIFFNSLVMGLMVSRIDFSVNVSFLMNESAVETIIAIIVETNKSPKNKGSPANLAIAGITDSLPACLASSIAQSLIIEIPD